MKCPFKIAIGFVVIVAIIAAIAVRDSSRYDLREIELLKTNFNNYQPSIWDRLRGIQNNEAKYEYHLRELEKLGLLVHTNFVFSNVPYTWESDKHIWRAACSNFPSAVDFSSKYYDTNNPAYGVRPCALEVWDFRTNMQRWSDFWRTNNR